MKIIYITFLFLVTFNFICCYDDKGNYEYKQINDIEISFPDYNFEQVIGETFKLYPVRGISRTGKRQSKVKLQA